MLPRDLARQVRRIQILTSKAVNDVLAGEYHSVFKGQGMEFDEVREYQPGDDVRTIDWNVTARTGIPHIKSYVEERELTVFFLVDLSASGYFGSTGRQKNEVAAELCALLAFSAIRNNDKVGLIIFTDQVELFIPPRKGASHVLRLVRELLYFTPGSTGTNINAALDYFGRIMTKRCVTFLVSDFLAPDFSGSLRIAARRHDLIAVSMSDPQELELPDVGLLELLDAETGAPLLVDTGSRRVREEYRRNGHLRREILAASLTSQGADHIPLITSDDYVLDLVRFFRTRERRRNRA
ncbi:MAG: DUF58 domain-containing protein [Proteobacteria bacterium]|nr:DUF58 domain-containing protein [Pseudomonadota bacterium]MBU1688137.1 DUF58 domain-containing protein [Pseudomonadota bacterium]